MGRAEGAALQLLRDVPLAPRTTLVLGGCARLCVEASTESDIVEACDYARENDLRLWILGGGSNVVIPDTGLDGLVLCVSSKGLEFSEHPQGVRLRASGGERWDDVVRSSVENELAGIECLSGIPGCVGATPIQNVGAYGQEVAETIESVRAYDRVERRFVELSREECHFAYRDSRFKSEEPGRYVVSEVVFVLSRSRSNKPAYPELARALSAIGAAPTLTDVRETVLHLRRQKSMLAEPGDPNARSCGSFFLNPVVSSAEADRVERQLGVNLMPRYPQPDGRVKLSAAWLIERAGWDKGTRRGNVGISTKHALALVCHDGATSAELLAFSEEVRRQVAARTGVTLTPEPQFL
ncbi:MAG: UDP-N-acetylmuramate dehydrogenase [Myxococcota bacterium]